MILQPDQWSSEVSLHSKKTEYKQHDLNAIKTVSTNGKTSFFRNTKHCIKLIVGQSTNTMGPILFGIVIGTLVAGIALASTLTIYLQQQSKQSIDVFLKGKQRSYSYIVVCGIRLRIILSNTIDCF